MGMGMNHWEWEEMGLKKTFPHTSSHGCIVGPRNKVSKMNGRLSKQKKTRQQQIDLATLRFDHLLA